MKKLIYNGRGISGDGHLGCSIVESWVWVLSDTQIFVAYEIEVEELKCFNPAGRNKLISNNLDTSQ